MPEVTLKQRVDETTNLSRTAASPEAAVASGDPTDETASLPVSTGGTVRDHRVFGANVSHSTAAACGTS